MRRKVGYTIEQNLTKRSIYTFWFDKEKKFLDLCTFEYYTRKGPEYSWVLKRFFDEENITKSDISKEKIKVPTRISEYILKSY